MTMPGLSKIRSVAGKLEANEGIPETLGAADVFYCEAAKFTPETEQLLRAHHLPTLSKIAAVAGRTAISINFKVPLYGAAAAGTSPFWVFLRQICGGAVTIVASTSVKISPATYGIKSATLKLFLDAGVSMRLKGCRGTYAAERSAGQIAYDTYTITGIWDPKTDADAVKDEAILAGNAFPSFLPKPFVAALFQIGPNYKANISKLSYDVGNKIEKRPTANVTAYKSIQITDRDVKGSFDSEAVTRATEDFWSKFTNQTPFNVQAYIGAHDSGVCTGINNKLMDDSRDALNYVGTAGVGTSNTMTDSGASWTASQWIGYRLVDLANTTFYISANTATTLTVVGTPASGAYTIQKPSSDYGTGTGTLNTMTDATKTWITGQWIGYSLIDSAGALKAITANTATTLTITSTPASGAYGICMPAYDNNTTGTGASNSFTDGTKTWATNQWAGFKLKDAAGTIFTIVTNTGTVLTVVGTPATGAYTISLPTRNWTVNQWVGYSVVDADGTPFVITANDATSITVSGIITPGNYVIYQAGKLIREKFPQAQYTGLNDGDRNGVQLFDTPFAARLTSGDDEVETFII